MGIVQGLVRPEVSGIELGIENFATFFSLQHRVSSYRSTCNGHKDESFQQNEFGM